MGSVSVVAVMARPGSRAVMPTAIASPVPSDEFIFQIYHNQRYLIIWVISPTAGG
jgi:hypothetical protein